MQPLGNVFGQWPLPEPLLERTAKEVAHLDLFELKRFYFQWQGAFMKAHQEGKSLPDPFDLVHRGGLASKLRELRPDRYSDEAKDVVFTILFAFIDIFSRWEQCKWIDSVSKDQNDLRAQLENLWYKILDSDSLETMLEMGEAINVFCDQHLEIKEKFPFPIGTGETMDKLISILVSPMERTNNAGAAPFAMYYDVLKMRVDKKSPNVDTHGAFLNIFMLANHPIRLRIFFGAAAAHVANGTNNAKDYKGIIDGPHYWLRMICRKWDLSVNRPYENFRQYRTDGGPVPRNRDITHKFKPDNDPEALEGLSSKHQAEYNGLSHAQAEVRLVQILDNLFLSNRKDYFLFICKNKYVYNLNYEEISCLMTAAIHVYGFFDRYLGNNVKSWIQINLANHIANDVELGYHGGFSVPEVVSYRSHLVEFLIYGAYSEAAQLNGTDKFMIRPENVWALAQEDGLVANNRPLGDNALIPLELPFVIVENGLNVDFSTLSKNWYINGNEVLIGLSPTVIAVVEKVTKPWPRVLDKFDRYRIEFLFGLLRQLYYSNNPTKKISDAAPDPMNQPLRERYRKIKHKMLPLPREKKLWRRLTEWIRTQRV